MKSQARMERGKNLIIPQISLEISEITKIGFFGWFIIITTANGVISWKNLSQSIAILSLKK